MTIPETHTALNALFSGHMSRNERNVLKAMQEAGISDAVLQELIASGLIVRRDIGEHIHYERQAFGERAISRVLNQHPQ